MFSAPAGEIASWADVERLGESEKGHQRRQNDSKVTAIARYLELEPRNTIPTAITIAIRTTSVPEDPEAVTTGTMCIEVNANEPKPGLVIDGQHRLYGMDKFDSDMPVNVVAILNPDDAEIAFQFLVINNKATKVTTNHIKALSLQYNDTELEMRLRRTARMSLSKLTAVVGMLDFAPDSPFYGQVEWPINTDASRHLVLPAALEAAVSYISMRKPPELADEEAVVDFFMTLWKQIRTEWAIAWHQESKLLSKAGLVAFTMFLVDDLLPLIERGYFSPTDLDATATEVQRTLASLEPNFWLVGWTARGLDTQAGRQVIMDALSKVRQNKRLGQSWYRDVPLIDETTVQVLSS
jgi:DGQHR domain-containing protein